MTHDARHLSESEVKLITALEEAIFCVQWMRQFRTDQQNDEGIPSEAIWLGVIAEAKGRELATTQEFLKLCVLATTGKLDRAAIKAATEAPNG